jgi:DNA-binding MarR family transcriptional regulator
MTTKPPLTRDIGQTERTLQALIHRQLARAGVTFPEWVVLTFLTASGPLTAGNLAQRLTDDEIAPSAVAVAVVGAMVEKGLIGPATSSPGEPEAPRLTVTDAGTAVYVPLRAAIGQLTGDLFADIDATDLDATRRTLNEVTRRAKRLLA